MGSFDSDIEALDEAIRLFAQTIKRPQRWDAVKAQANVSLDRPAAIILQLLMHNKPHLRRVQDLAVQLGIEPPSVTRKTQELERAGYLRRVPDPIDRRAVDLRITARGRAAANRLRNAQRRILSEALVSWKPAERQQFIRLFERFSRDLLTASMKPSRPPLKKKDRNA